MKSLKEKIRVEGTVRGGNILKVDKFLNHQIDVKFLNEIGEEFKRRFEGEKIDKILTIEASGIAIASITSQHFDYIPVVFAKKTDSLNIDSELYTSNVHSYTKNKDYTVMVSKKFINKGERILVIDDFLANGCAALGLIDILKQGGAELVGVGIVIEKGFQCGRKLLEDKGVRVESLAIVEKMEDGQIYFKN